MRNFIQEITDEFNRIYPDGANRLEELGREVERLTQDGCPEDKIEENFTERTRHYSEELDRFIEKKLTEMGPESVLELVEQVENDISKKILLELIFMSMMEKMAKIEADLWSAIIK